jgi:SpoVK/Ycf46/Vps4 family AAA+-type ATPase
MSSRRTGRSATSDLNAVLARKRQLVSDGGALEYVESPATIDDVGGLVHLKSWLAARERSFGDDAASFGLTPPRGVLLLGVQGAGKSLCAKAIATAWGRPLLRLDPGTLYDRYVGESERRLRDALRQAEAMAPIVLWIDEIEKGFASAAAQSTDGGLSQRMFGTLLTWMQDHAAPVFLVATANNIDALPPELLRKGRFDEIFFVDLPGAEARRVIFAIHLRRRGRDPESFDLDRLAGASDGFSGAEIEQAVVSALHGAFSAGREPTTEAIEEAVRTSPPLSVTMGEKIAALRRWARDRCVPAG